MGPGFTINNKWLISFFLYSYLENKTFSCTILYKILNKLINFRMYINFVNDQKYLGYGCLIDTQCGNRLVLITDSSIVFVKNVTLNGKRKAKKLFVHGMFLFQLGQPLVPCAAAVMLPLPPAIELGNFSFHNLSVLLPRNQCFWDCTVATYGSVGVVEWKIWLSTKSTMSV